MKNINEKLNILKDTMAGRKIKIMILGLGSVGGYLLDYLMSSKDDGMEICVVGRNVEKIGCKYCKGGIHDPGAEPDKCNDPKQCRFERCRVHNSMHP